MADPTPDPRLLSEEELAGIWERNEAEAKGPLRVAIHVPGDWKALRAHIAAQQEEIERLRDRQTCEGCDRDMIGQTVRCVQCSLRMGGGRTTASRSPSE